MPGVQRADAAIRLARAVGGERTVANDQEAVRLINGQDRGLIIGEFAMLDGQVAALGTNAGAVAVGHPDAGENQTAQRHVVAADHERRFTGAGSIREHRTGRSRVWRRGGFNGYAVGLPDRAVEIFAGVDHHAIPVRNHPGSCRGSLQLPVRPNFQGARRSGADR